MPDDSRKLWDDFPFPLILFPPAQDGEVRNCCQQVGEVAGEKGRRRLGVEIAGNFESALLRKTGVISDKSGLDSSSISPGLLLF